MYKSCRHNALRADMLVRPYGWFANIHGASGYGCTLTILFQQPRRVCTTFQQSPRGDSVNYGIAVCPL